MPPKRAAKADAVVAKFKEGDSVYCLDTVYGQQYYQAKITKVFKEANNVEYMVHYQGWKKKFDERIAEKDGRILADTPENKEIIDKHNVRCLVCIGRWVGGFCDC